ncbi:NADH-quinone oxidoreductase subunit C [Candidatus Nitrosocosmicus franklandus]|uniref:NAD(P)H-quinone oxidoreductase subunit J n=1 Tax=Candidatus Nitrosocosmicus franklandianus TaxID=1798806 RepID=A0A484IGV1_9ARCH|nr:NADH-quinone oxidoreductase subunit C [Candidatus Nitrosocosmicus franklandus]VFJ15252.1 NAD(P)H-quinone oxidoreductase subunit J [Candidatus Nitrosocosmicus franklandus]
MEKAIANVNKENHVELKEDSNYPLSSELLSSLANNFGDKVGIVYKKEFRSKIMVKPENLVEVALFLRNHHGFDHAESASGTDYPADNEIELNYHLGSYSNTDYYPYIVILSTRVNRDDPKSNSLINIFPSVEYHERETYEMLGVYFLGHPRNERFILPEDWADIPPLRKDFRIKGR